ncbi:MAG: hypothetical protein IJI14_08085 [Anaerolineaceae bacterium]|nr:hypothetical protein [Anaerolineaceae bacterium]
MTEHQKSAHVTDVFSKMTDEIIPADQKLKLLEDSIREAWRKNEDENLKIIEKDLSRLKTHNIGDLSRIELFAKLGVFFSLMNISSIPENKII